MVSSARQAIACVLLIFIVAVGSQSQVTPAKNDTAGVSGKVTRKNKGVPGIVVAARDPNSGYGRSNYRATTDQSGNYRISNMAPGTYQIVPISPGWISENELFQKSLVIEDGDNVENVNFSLVRGGVITGKITDADGKPVVEEPVFVQPIGGVYAVTTTAMLGGIMTDDRGIYRAFALRPGKYQVSVGQADNQLLGGSRVFRQTFYPSVTDSAKATLIEVTDQGEVSDIDITLGRPKTGFKVTGKIVDSETGKPVANVRYGIHLGNESGGGSTSSGASSNANGEFKFERVMPGKYSVFILPDQNTEVRADWVPFEVTDHDISGLVVKTVRAASVFGVVVFEGVEDPSAIAKLGNLYVTAMGDRLEARFQGSSFVRIGPDGSFKLTGLSPGVANFGLTSRTFDGTTKQLALVRVERDGMSQPNGITIKDAEQITGVRLVIKSLTGSIRGQVKVEDGELTENARMSIWLKVLDDTPSSPRGVNINSSPQIDSRGRFVIEGVAGGTYEINIAVFEPSRFDTSRIFKQQVTVADNAVTEVTVSIKLKP
ncbi:MAG TPA: carboxypeptidase-like regulatory domain-containing protein [Pyrinomonadaceae bacterium]|jgi:protocatechuate 3,4-dioxygenase beta subunit|nr:carboxypeptidase-like regulatory domain-containing protein [Pyrinomonadaceae bacterium]